MRRKIKSFGCTRKWRLLKINSAQFITIGFLILIFRFSSKIYSLILRSLYKAIKKSSQWEDFEQISNLDDTGLSLRVLNSNNRAK